MVTTFSELGLTRAGAFLVLGKKMRASDLNPKFGHGTATVPQSASSSGDAGATLHCGDGDGGTERRKVDLRNVEVTDSFWICFIVAPRA